MTERSVNESALADVLNLPEPVTGENAFDPDAPVIDTSLFYNLATLIVVLFCVIPVGFGITMIGFNATLSIPGKIGTYLAAGDVHDAHDQHLAMMDDIETEDGIPFPELLKHPPTTESMTSEELEQLAYQLEATLEYQIFEKRTDFILRTRVPEILQKVSNSDDLNQYLTNTSKERAIEQMSSKAKDEISKKLKGMAGQFTEALPEEFGDGLQNMMQLNEPDTSKRYLSEEELAEITAAMLLQRQRLAEALGYVDPETGKQVRPVPTDAEWVFEQLFTERYSPKLFQQNAETPIDSRRTDPDVRMYQMLNQSR
jgi:hypothetical protein